MQKKLARDRVRQREYARRLPPVNVSRIVDHIDHIVKLVGVDHVGIGSDFDGVQITTADLATVAELPNLTRELLRRGYSESDVDKILGGNMLRVMESIEVNVADGLHVWSWITARPTESYRHQKCHDQESVFTLLSRAVFTTR